LNIFVTSPSPTKSARFLDNVRLVKMCLETAQILSTTLRCYGFSGDVYRITHENHPACIWARQNRANYNWLLAHFRALCDEYTKRYGKTHKSFGKFQLFVENANLLPEGKRTEFANCAANKEKGVCFKHLPVFEAYKKYLFVRFAGDSKPAVCNWGGKWE
jgi:hypothetical protein